MAPGMSATEHITHPPINFEKAQKILLKKTRIKGQYLPQAQLRSHARGRTDWSQLVDGLLTSPHLIRRSKPTPLAELRRVEGESMAYNPAG